LLNIVTCMSDYRRGLDWRLDLLNTYTLTTHDYTLQVIDTQQVKVEVTLRLTVSQSVSLGVEPRILFDSYGLVFVELSEENGSIFCICCWPSPA
jgi:hypothetical protein